MFQQMKNSTLKNQNRQLRQNKKNQKTGEQPEQQDENEQNAQKGQRVQIEQKGEVQDLTEQLHKGGQAEREKGNIIYAHSEL